MTTNITLRLVYMHPKQEPEFNHHAFFFSDATTDEELLSPLVSAVDHRGGEHFTYNVYGDLVEVSTTLEEEEVERDHARRLEQEHIRHHNALANIRLTYNWKQQKELLKLILPRVAPSLETLVYLPYLQSKNYGRDDAMINIFLEYATSFVSLKRLTLRMSTSQCAVLPEFPTLTHLHLINPAPSIRTISALSSALPSLAYLRLTSFNELRRLGSFIH
ncbi:hypothetical protein BDZ89DRAFT_1165643 [Hymenopellis radicata]|nr:hypothetical protein BDZ89DRAFT_1165643 [Hymenopellis radicata]